MKRLLMLLFLASQAYSAEFLIYNKDHWMTELTETQVREYIKSGKISQEEYNSRPQRGDICGVYKDGSLKGIPSKKCAYGYVRVPGVIVNKELVAMHMSPVDPNVCLNEYRHNLDLVFSARMSIMITPAQTINALTDKSLSAKENDERKKLLMFAYIALLALHC